MYRYLVFLFLLANIVAAQPQDNTQTEVVFRSVNVIPMDQERILQRQTVIVKNGRITWMGPDSQAKPAPGAIIVEASGKYLIPGLAEMHAHVPPIDDIEPMKEVLTLFLA